MKHWQQARSIALHIEKIRISYKMPHLINLISSETRVLKAVLNSSSSAYIHICTIKSNARNVPRAKKKAYIYKNQARNTRLIYK